MEKNKGFFQINKLIEQTARKRRLTEAANKYRVMKYWEKAALDFIQQAQDYTKAIDFKNGILVVACLSKETAYQIKLLAQRIILVLNELIGKQIVYAIQIEY